MCVAENAKKLINKQGLKQNFIACKAGYTPKVFNALLNGGRVMRDTDVLRIATALEVTPNVLFGIETKTQ